jgi:hypothetical protein
MEAKSIGGTMQVGSCYYKIQKKLMTNAQEEIRDCPEEDIESWVTDR